MTQNISTSYIFYTNKFLRSYFKCERSRILPQVYEWVKPRSIKLSGKNMMQLLKVIQSTQVSKLPLDESGLNLPPPNAYLSMHSRFTSQAFKRIGCLFVSSCRGAVSRFISQALLLSSCVHEVKRQMGNFFLTTLPAFPAWICTGLVNKVLCQLLSINCQGMLCGRHNSTVRAALFEFIVLRFIIFCLKKIYNNHLVAEKTLETGYLKCLFKRACFFPFVFIPHTVKEAPVSLPARWSFPFPDRGSPQVHP